MHDARNVNTCEHYCLHCAFITHLSPYIFFINQGVYSPDSETCIMLLVKIAILDDIYEDSIHQFTHVRLRDRIKHSLEKELNIHNGNELATHIHYALTETPYKDKMTAALYGFRELKELEVKDEKQLEEANMQVLSLVIEVLKIVNAYKLEIKKHKN